MISIQPQERNICDLNRILQLSSQRALLRLILHMDILMTECWKEDCNARLELKERCLVDRDGCYTPTKTLPTFLTHWSRHLSWTPSLSLWVLEWCAEAAFGWGWASFGRGADSEGTIKWTGTSLEGGACGFTYIDKAAVSVCWATSSHTSLSALSSFRRNTASSMNGFLILLKQRWPTSREFCRE